ncbi:hypothetical protein EDB19DRAFT_1831557 [Suillus lakei]|nr:hypothetical protein EDB19DRAFT_1831557 [Suillus lakei]
MATAFTPSTPTESQDSSLAGRPLDPNNRLIVIQNNHIAAGGTINIFSSNSYGSTVTKLEHVAAQPAEPSPQRPLARQLAPVDYGRESVVFNGNTFGEHVVINVASPNSTGAEPYGFAIEQLIKPLFRPKPRATFNDEQAGFAGGTGWSPATILISYPFLSHRENLKILVSIGSVGDSTRHSTS